MSFRIDGAKLAQKINHHTKQMISSLPITPTLATVIVKTGHQDTDSANQLYVRMKTRKAQSIGIKVENYIFSSDCTEAKLSHCIVQLNNSNHINGILVQLPLPAQINPAKIEDMIDPLKDVDGVNPVNIGKLTTNVDKNKDFYFTGATPTGIMQMLKTYYLHTQKNQKRLYELHWSQVKAFHYVLSGAKAVILGKSNIVGRPLALMLLNAGCEVTVLNHFYSTDKSLKTYTRSADIIISATGHINTITSKNINSQHAVMIDAGENTNPKNGKLCGDISSKAKKLSKAYSPVPSGVGPVTIAMLLRNVFNAVRYH